MQKKRYLYQLLITSSLLLIIPVVIFFGFFFQRSYNEISRTNTEYYERITKLFCGTLVNEISTIKEHAVTFSVNSQIGGNSHGIFYEGTDKMAENSYYYAAAIEELREYNKKSGLDNVGIYYYDKAFVLYGTYKSSLEYFVDEYLEANTNGDISENIFQFFSDVEFEKNRVILKPLYDKKGDYKSLMAGVCVHLGKNDEKALFFTQLKQEDFAFFYQSVQGRTWENYYVLDGDTGEFLFGFHNADIRNIEGISENKTIPDISKQDNKNIFVTKNERYNLDFVVDVSEHEEQNIVFVIYNNMRVFLIYILCIMTVMCFAAVFFNYYPIYRLLSKIQGKGKDEFDVIMNVWEEQNKELSEHQTMMLELIMNRLIYGLPISEKYIRKMKIYDEQNLYCVHLIDGYVLDTEEIRKISDNIGMKYHVDLYMSDLQGEKTTVIVSFMEENLTDKLTASLSEWCGENIHHDYKIYAGHVVEKINDIDQSLKTCKDKRKVYLAQQNNLSHENHEEVQTIENDSQQKMVMRFNDENLMNRDLNRTMVADKFYISVYSVGRICKNQFGVNFSEYVSGKRMEKAKQMMTETDLTIGEISAAVGIDDANYFARIFKQNYGISPTEFRKKK